MPRQKCGRQSNKSDSHATFLEILDDPIAGPWIHHPAPEVQAGRAVVEFLADGPCGHRLVGQVEQAQYGAQPGVGGVDGFEAVGGVQGDQL